MNMITLKNIQKSYGTHQVLKDVNLNIHQGEIYGLIGKNDAGKTTIFKIILGLSEFEHGKISILFSSDCLYLCPYMRMISNVNPCRLQLAMVSAGAESLQRSWQNPVCC